MEEVFMNQDRAPCILRDASRTLDGGHHNHSLYFENMTPDGSPPTGRLNEIIVNQFKRLANLKYELFRTATREVFAPVGYG